MDNLAIFQKAVSVLEEGHPVALVTVVSVVGSTPGKVGYKMLVFDEGHPDAQRRVMLRTVGTVGGGLTEAKMIAEAAAMLGAPRSRLSHFDLGGTPDDEKGICGGSVDLLVEAFDATALPLFQELCQAAQAGEAGTLVSFISPDGLPRKLLAKDMESVADVVRTADPAPMPALDEAGVRVTAEGIDAFLEPLVVPPCLILFGAGHVAAHIARLAKSVHFRVVVCDDRGEYANAQRFPDADRIVVEGFARVFDHMQIDERSYLVIVTRGHRHDAIVLERAVRTNARYIGMIGSRRKTLTLLENLRAQGLPQERLDRVYSPIGIALGAVTAEEIALSIVCELVKVRRLGDEAEVRHMTLSRNTGATHD